MRIAVDPLPGWVAQLGEGGVAFLVATRAHLRLLRRTSTAGEFIAVYDDTAAARSCVEAFLTKNDSDR